MNTEYTCIDWRSTDKVQIVSFSMGARMLQAALAARLLQATEAASKRWAKARTLFEKLCAHTCARVTNYM